MREGGREEGRRELRGYRENEREGGVPFYWRVQNLLILVVFLVPCILSTLIKVTSKYNSALFPTFAGGYLLKMGTLLN